jgi:AraC family transcriptional regulator, melibiose operon regulatory protein
MRTFDTRRTPFSPYGFSCELWRPSKMARPDRHNEIELNLLKGGSLTYLLGGRKVRILPERVHAFWAAVPHQIVDFEGDAEYFVLTVPLGWFLQCRLPEMFVRSLLHGEVVSEADAVDGSRDTQAFATWRKDFSDAGSEPSRPALLEVEARLWRLGKSFAATAAVKPPARSRGDGGSMALRKVERMASYIAQFYTRPLKVEEVAAHVGLHPNYAMSTFRQAVGSTLVGYITQHRILHAQRLLATSDARITAVAMTSGFSSMSRFNAAFLERCGCSPRQYRKLHLLN